VFQLSEEDSINIKLMELNDPLATIEDVAYYLGYSNLNPTVNKNGLVTLLNGEKRQIEFNGVFWKLNNSI
jgi:hypothetical protein